MAQDNKVQNLIINKLTKEQYKSLENKSNTEIYEITDSAHFTEQEINESLEKKQDKLTAGTGIEILPDGTINNTQTSAEWGKITGAITDQLDLQTELNKKVDKVEGKSLISDTEIERLATLQNYDDTEVRSLITDLDNSKQDKLTAGDNISITQQEDNLVISAILNNISTDNTTIQNNDDILSAIGVKTKSDGVLYSWVGTLDQYNTDLESGKIDENTQCLITDDEEELFASVDLEVPTKLSELANDTQFVNETQLSTKQDKLTAGTGISIQDNVISSLQTGAEWGNITGALNAQTDLKEKFNTKVDKEDGKSLVSDTEIERLATLQNYDDTEVKTSISNLEETKANIDLNNLTTTGEKHFLNKYQLTNCLLEVPQRIKLELNDGVLTLKAGSKVIVPNGFEADGVTPRFDYVTVESDKFASGYSNLSGEIFMAPDALLTFTANNQITSGVSATIGKGNVWYDTANNLVKRCDDGSTWNSGYSLPLCLITSDGNVNSKIASINQVFNGMGYIGSTVWVDKGVKGLIPNGRNEDGSLNNIEYTTEKLTIKSLTTNSGSFRAVIVNNGTVFLPAELNFTNGLREFNVEDNYFKEGSAIKYWCEVGGITADTASPYTITSFNPKLPFRAVDYNDIDGQLVVSYNHPLSQKSIAYNGTITCDLSDYLPNDGNVYEVDCSLWASSGTTNGNGFNLAIISDYINSYHGMAYNVTRTEGKTAYASGTCKIPVGVGRYIKVINNTGNTGGTSKVSIQLHSYRKVR